jgi:DNA mismatch endonuclease, patch repair protein
VDKISKEARSQNMKAIRSTKTTIEERVSKALWSKGIRFRKNVKSLKGKPDIAIKKYKCVIFIDSCFWHACPQHGHIPKSNIEFWQSKLNRNRERDAETNDYYREIGWHVIRIWEHELKENFIGVIDQIAQFIRTFTLNKK